MTVAEVIERLEQFPPYMAVNVQERGEREPEFGNAYKRKTFNELEVKWEDGRPVIVVGDWVQGRIARRTR